MHMIFISVFLFCFILLNCKLAIIIDRSNDIPNIVQCIVLVKKLFNPLWCLKTMLLYEILLLPSKREIHLYSIVLVDINLLFAENFVRHICQNRLILNVIFYNSFGIGFWDFSIFVILDPLCLSQLNIIFSLKVLYILSLPKQNCFLRNMQALSYHFSKFIYC